MCSVASLPARDPEITLKERWLTGLVQSMEASVAAERAFTCGNGKYYVVEQSGYLIVQRQDWLGRTFINYARNLAEAIARIEADAHCWQIQAA
jgi:hypothetical protein